MARRSPRARRRRSPPIPRSSRPISGPPMLRIDGIDVAYGDVQVLWDVSFEVKKGEIVALIGANGSGKSTTLAGVWSLLKPRKGGVYYEGAPIHTRAPHDMVSLGIAHVPEARRLFAEMTVKENLLLGALTPEEQVLLHGH